MCIVFVFFLHLALSYILNVMKLLRIQFCIAFYMMMNGHKIAMNNQEYIYFADVY